MAGCFLILGHPRSGTVHTSILLNRCGLFVQHEQDLDYIEKNYHHRPKIDGIVTGLFRRVKPNFSNYYPILHQVRHPLDVISSARRMRSQAVNNLFRTCVKENVRVSGRLHQAMYTWYAFTEMADAVSVYTYKLETMRENWMAICGLLQISPCIMPSVRNDINGHEKIELTWEELYEKDDRLANLIKLKARAYGYE